MYDANTLRKAVEQMQEAINTRLADREFISHHVEIKSLVEKHSLRKIGEIIRVY